MLNGATSNCCSAPPGTGYGPADLPNSGAFLCMRLLTGFRVDCLLAPVTPHDSRWPLEIDTEHPVLQKWFVAPTFAEVDLIRRSKSRHRKQDLTGFRGFSKLERRRRRLRSSQGHNLPVGVEKQLDVLSPVDERMGRRVYGKNPTPLKGNTGCTRCGRGSFVEDFECHDSPYSLISSQTSTPQPPIVKRSAPIFSIAS